MARLRRANNSEIAPCIVSKVRYELGLTNRKPVNSKSCSNTYWNETVDVVSDYYKDKVQKGKIKSAKR